MKRICKFLLIIALLPLCALAAGHAGVLRNTGLRLTQSSGELYVATDFVLDSLRVGSNRQLYVTPVVEDPEGRRAVLPSVLINGRNMHYAYERGSLPKDKQTNYNVAYEVRRRNGKPQTLSYKASVPMESWMLSPAASVRLVVDTCGCGHPYGSSLGDPQPLGLNPAPRMHSAYISPAVTDLPVSVHEGRARVQFEVDRTELHPEPYVCRNGQRLDNRDQLRVIEDSVRYALNDPNVEIASIDICGYASPESPYLHNEYLATNRSRALAEYIGTRFNLPSDKCTYGSVPENWEEFRELVVNAGEITERQRADLLELIDRPAYGPSDYDAKERTLKTDKRFASLYRSKILPEWFPKLRCTQFAIKTRLKPLSDKDLDKVIDTTPGLMSLNQMFRVARLYPEGSERFNEVIETALRYYPDDPVANLNAAVAAIGRGDLDAAARLLDKAGDTPQAFNARGVIACYKGDFDAARKYFRMAGELPEAVNNLRMLEF